ncbi:MAG: L,D-transpeptidase [Eubacteriales bacterium]|nr:L,D-transpeptidase [Eubacteriales bacterium]
MQERARQARKRIEKEAKRRDKKKKRQRILCIQIGIICLGVIALCYTVYDKIADSRKIGCRTAVCGQKISHLTVDEAVDKVEKVFENTELVFKENKKTVYKVTLGEAGYFLDKERLEQELAKLKDDQKSCWGPLQLPRNYRIEYQVEEQADKKAAAFSADHFGDFEKRKDSVDAHLVYNKDSGQYDIAVQEQGNQIDEARLTGRIDEILKDSFEKDLLTDKIKINVDVDVYKVPKMNEEDSEIKELQQEMNKRARNYPKSSITYTFGEVEETLSSETIHSWIIQEDGEIHLDENAMRDYITYLCDTYDTMYVPRKFETSLDFTADILANNYGYLIDPEGELAQMYEDLESGGAVRREPVYSRTGLGRNGNDDLLGSYIEVCIMNQHLWLYRDGVLITETDIISGKPTGFNALTGMEEDWSTLYGAYSIAYKQAPSVLSSDIYGYETEVNYWMPFEDGQGLHDALWQTYFGGDTYLTNGSHGCINLPLDQAAVIYANIDAGYPIIIY